MNMTEKQVFILWMQSLNKDVNMDEEGKFTCAETEARFRGWLGRADVQKALEAQQASNIWASLPQ